MNKEIVVPSLGESVTEATVAKWHKKAGDAVNVDELLVELETDKVTLEVNAPASGTISDIKVAEGENVAVGDTLGFIKEGEVKGTVSQPIVESQDSGAVKDTVVDVSKEKLGVISSPSAAKIAADNQVPLDTVHGTGKDGRITKGDVLSTIGNMSDKQTTIVSPASDDKLEQRVKMTRLRKTIAQRLKDSQNTAAILTTFNEIDMSEVIRCRKIYQEKFKEKHAIKLGFMSFFVKAVVAALKEIPSVNAEIDGDYIVYKNHYDIGVAVGTEQGLVVPVIRNADDMSQSEIEKAIVMMGKKAREGKLSISDMSGGTFSITNGGIYRSLLSTPIINPPQSAILGMHNIVERPIAVNNEVVIRPMMYTALSYDHRIIDGKEAVTFLVRIKELVENPERMLFEI